MVAKRSCPQCGAPFPSDARFCTRCGTSIRRSHARAEDLLGFLSVGVGLIILAVTYLRYPETPTALVEYIEAMVALKTYVKPPQILFDVLSSLFYAAGFLGFILAALRLVVQRSMRKAISDLTGGVFAFISLYLLTGYAEDIFTGRMTVAYFIIATGVLVIVNVVIQLRSRPRQRTSS